ncbi:MAG: Gfo/Idh/MocA family oxidoreductase [Acidobacteria bacterium]|nr:Gfo/Idh/MocA family oxidoreductase [Acidobacteriota bacterium]
MNRRSFLKHAGAGLAAPFFVPNLISAPRYDTLRLAAFGAAGMAWATLDGIATHPKVKLVCAAEVDSTRLDELKGKYRDARIYQDWREMLQKERKNLDIACVGTPDHMHAPQAMSSMNIGLHVYCQKPLAHDLYEIRRLTETARRKRLVSQMGIQIHSAAEYRAAVQIIQAGAIGKVKEVHSWSNKKWGDMNPLPDRTDPVPPTLNWDLWLGTAAARPYIDGVYHPGNWRKRVDFGTATFGDMGCHIYDPVFGALALTAPLTVRSEGPAPSAQNWAINAVIQYVFPGTRFTDGKTVKVTWYDGDQRPPAEIQSLVGPRIPGQGSIFIGTKGVMLLPHIAMPSLYPEAQFKGFEMPKLETADHYHQFVDAVLGKGTASAAFDYSGPLTEAVLLGPAATWFPKTTLEWNAAKLKFRNSPEANRHIRRAYRPGWKVKGLA